MKMNFTERSNEKEMMDDLSFSGKGLRQVMYELETINNWLGGYNTTIRGLWRLAKLHTNRTVTIADIGCGGGDTLVRIAKWARKKQLDIRLVGIDANPNIVAYAQENTKQFPEITFLVADIFSDSFLEQRYDIITATLFTHHFTDAQLIHLFKQFQQQAILGVVINDLHRHWFAYWSIKVLTQLFSKSEMVKHDGPISVLRSFRRREWAGVLSSAGIHQYALKWHWAFRWLLSVPAPAQRNG